MHHSARRCQGPSLFRLDVWGFAAEFRTAGQCDFVIGCSVDHPSNGAVVSSSAHDHWTLDMVSPRARSRPRCGISVVVRRHRPRPVFWDVTVAIHGGDGIVCRFLRPHSQLNGECLDEHGSVATMRATATRGLCRHIWTDVRFYFVRPPSELARALKSAWQRRKLPRDSGPWGSRRALTARHMLASDGLAVVKRTGFLEGLIP
jgi:hypothetical protein